MKRLFCLIGLPCLLVLLMQFSAYPYLFCYFFNFPSESIMIFAFTGVFLLYYLNIKGKSEYVNPKIGGIMLSQAIVWFFYFLFHNDSSYLVRILLILESYLVIQVLSKKDVLLKFARIYNWSLLIQGVCGVIAFFLLFMGLIHPIAEYYFTQDRYELCYLLTCSNTVYGNFMRIGGYFDEPGALAFWGMFALVINKLTYDSKFIEYCLICSLLFTFSAAFFVLVPIYLLFFYHNHLRKFFLVLLLGFPIFYMTYNYLSTSDDVAVYTTERFKDGTINSTRFEQGEIAKKLFLQSPIIGNGATEISVKHRNAEENPYEILAKDGIVGFVFTYLPLLFLVIKYRRDKIAMYSVLLLATDYLQRPFHINQMHFFMLYFFCTIVIIRNRYPQYYDSQLQKSLQ